MIPKVQYADTSSGQVAYMVFGEGPLEILCCEGAGFHLELAWDLPIGTQFYRALGSFARVALFDRRGYGMSDPVPSGKSPTWEDGTEDFRVVMDAAGFKRPALLVYRDAAIAGLLFAGMHPDRISALITCNGAPYAYAEPGYDGGLSRETSKHLSQKTYAGWGTEEYLAFLYPSLAHDSNALYILGRMCRSSASPRRVVETLRYNSRLDARPFLRAISVPTLIAHNVDYPIAPFAAARYLAEHIPGAKLVALPGADNTPYATNQDVFLGHVREFLTGTRQPVEADTVLATVLFLDLVGSTELAAKLGDKRWRETLEQFYKLARAELVAFRGREMDTAGDGLFAAFEGPGRAIRCAMQIRERVKSLNLELRAGIHTGECEKLGDKLAGMTVNIGARVCAKADAGEIVVSNTVKDLLIGSGIEFTERGAYQLKGVPGEWRLFATARNWHNG